jgi:hypothetical protein
MSEDTENFEQLRRLLKLKRYEQPPPRYFNDFSSRVIARIKLGKQGEYNASLTERVRWEAPWLLRIWSAFEAKPVLAGAFGFAMCALLITGVIYSERSDVQPMALIPGAESSVSSSEEIATAMAENHPLLAKPAALEASSTSPIPADESLLGNLQAQPASFAFPGGN